MLKKTITYTDYNGLERTEDFYFNLSRAEVTEMELSVNGGMSEYVKKIVAAQDGKTIIETFKKIVLAAYGEKSLDGRRFIKTPEITDSFAQTEAYVEIFMELSTDADAATKFVNGIIPEDKTNAPPMSVPTN